MSMELPRKHVKEDTIVREIGDIVCRYSTTIGSGGKHQVKDFRNAKFPGKGFTPE